MSNIIVAGIILAILSLSITKVVIEKRKGVKCVGCPHGGTTAKKNCCSSRVDIELK